MNRVLRLALTWLLLVAVPLQGYAAGGMLFCGDPGRTGPDVVQDHGRHAAGDHDHVHPAATLTGDADAAWDLNAATHGTCSVCASCCAGAALPAAAIAAAAEAPRAAATVVNERADPGRPAARLERPPRLHLA